MGYVIATHRPELREADGGAVRTQADVAARAAWVIEAYSRGRVEAASRHKAAEPALPPSKPTSGRPEIIRYRDTEIRRRAFGTTEWFGIVGSSRVYETLRDAKMAVNTQKLAASARLHDEALLSRFEAADMNGNARLEWEEIERFQSQLFSEFAYRENDTALAPHRFLSEGGGDCEDWALVTAALLRFWGIECLVGIVVDGKSSGSHAVALMRSYSPPAGAETLHVHEWMIRHVPNGQRGLYVPVDYDSVGAMSSPVGPDYWYIWVDRPEFLYDLGL